MNVALHSDAGYSKTNDIVGSLSIYTTDFNNGLLNSGNSRYASRDLADLLLTQIQKDIRAKFNIQWTRRSMWDRNYSETRLPATPSTIVELLSHQNFADMKLGHDPNFKFTVGRAIYKAVLQFISSQHNKGVCSATTPRQQLRHRVWQKKETPWNSHGRVKTIRWSLPPVPANTWYTLVSDTVVSTMEYV